MKIVIVFRHFPAQTSYFIIFIMFSFYLWSFNPNQFKIDIDVQICIIKSDNYFFRGMWSFHPVLKKTVE